MYSRAYVSLQRSLPTSVVADRDEVAIGAEGVDLRRERREEEEHRVPGDRPEARRDFGREEREAGQAHEPALVGIPAADHEHLVDHPPGDRCGAGGVSVHVRGGGVRVR